MSNWDDDNFEPQLPTPGTIVTNKWDDEDEEDNVKDNWDDEDDEKDKKEEELPKKIEEKPKPKKKYFQEKIAEKERMKREEVEKRLKQMQEEEEEDIPPEEKLRRQQESDLKLALETTFVNSNKNSVTIDSMYPTTKEEFDELSEALSKKLQLFTKSEEFPSFAENVIRNICANLHSNDLKKIKTTIDNLYLEKQKMEKGEKTKKKSKVKAKLRVDDNNLDQYSAYVDDYVEYDDFM